MLGELDIQTTGGRQVEAREYRSMGRRKASEMGKLRDTCWRVSSGEIMRSVRGDACYILRPLVRVGNEVLSSACGHVRRITMPRDSDGDTEFARFDTETLDLRPR